MQKIEIKRKMRKILMFFILLIAVIIICFLNFRLENVFFNYPKNIEINYKKISNLKEEKALGFIFLLPKDFVVGLKKENIVAYETEDKSAAFILKNSRPDLFSGPNAYEIYNKVLTNKWNPSYFILKYFIVSNWQHLEIKRINMNYLKGFVFSGTKKNQSKDHINYLYELFNENYGLTVAVKVSKEKNFKEEEINYLISTIRKISE